MLTFEDLTLENWAIFKSHVLKSECIFPSLIRTPYQEFVDLLFDTNTISKIALLDGEYVGNAIGYGLRQEDMEEHGLVDEPADGKIFYLFNFIIDEKFQGRDFGMQLLLEIIRVVRQEGYERVAGHFRENRAMSMNKRLGAREKAIVQNWYGTGENYHLCIIDLDRMPASYTLPLHVATETQKVQPDLQPDLQIQMRSPAVSQPAQDFLKQA